MRTALWLAIAMSPVPALAGVIGNDDRLTIADYAARHQESIASVRSQFGASGRIMCPFGEASAFLVHKNNVVVTARHVLFPERGCTPMRAK